MINIEKLQIYINLPKNHYSKILMTSQSFHLKKFKRQHVFIGYTDCLVTIIEIALNILPYCIRYHHTKFEIDRSIQIRLNKLV